MHLLIDPEKKQTGGAESKGNQVMAGLRKKLSGFMCALACFVVAGLWGATSAVAAPVPAVSKIHASVDQRLAKSQDNTARVWVFFADKGFTAANDEAIAIARLDATYDSRALTRRLHRRTDPGLTDSRDLPVSQTYIDAVGATGATVRHPSRWLNAISAVGTREQLARIAALPFVTKVQVVRQAQRVEPESVGPAVPPATGQTALAGIPFYGESEEQIMQIKLDQLHNLGFTGDGVVVGVLDTGFLRVHDAFNEPGNVLQVVAEFDFVKNDGVTSNQPGDPPNQHNHGTWILGTLGAYKPTELVGAAYDASFILCKTEDLVSETPIEEDNYVAGLEFIELNGGDMATASLSYLDWYTQADLDGMTAVTTIAVNTATANGMYCLNSAANNGHDANPTTSSLGAPADALQVLSVGAADNMGVIAGFSADGPSADGRIKPEILARGINTRTVDVNSTNLYVGVGGTSLSCPLAAGAVACLIEAHPTWTVQQMRTYLMLTADDYLLNGTYDPLYVRGFGVINALAASQQDCDGNAVNDLTDIANLTHPDCNANNIPDFCDLETEHSRDANSNSIPDECEPSPANDDCADASVPVECQNMTPNPDLGICSVSAGPPNIFEICDLTIGTAPQHDCVNPAATCGPAPPESGVYRCQFLADNRLASTDGPDTSGTACFSSGLNAFQSDVWFHYVPPCNGDLIIQNCADADYDSLIQVFGDHTATCPACPIDSNALNRGCNDDHCNVSGGGSALRIAVVENGCYAIRVGGRNSLAGQGTSTLDVGFVGNPDACPGTFPNPPSPAPAPHDRPKNRYISFAPDSSFLVGFRVQKTTVPSGSCWVQAPVQSGPDQYTAKCDANPVFRIWTEPVVHVGDCEIIPVSTYNIFTNMPGPVEIPTPLVVQTIPLPSLNSKLWGDAVGSNNGVEWTPPNQFTNVQDVLAILSFITGAAIQPHFTVANLQAISSFDSCLNSFVNTSDVLISVRAIAGDSYGPPSSGKIVDPTLCPVCP